MFTTIVPGSKRQTSLSQQAICLLGRTYHWDCRLKLLRMGVLNLEPTDIILKKESEGAIICVRKTHYCNVCDV